MPKPAFLVEGHMEQKILQSLCGGVPIRRIGCNGDDVAMSVIAEFVETHLRLLDNRFYPIVIIFDRERREASCDELKRELADELDSRGFPGQYLIGIPDRTIENWILADREMIKNCYDSVCSLQDYEGRFGKRELSKIIKKKYIYHETTLGVEMFLKCDPYAICQGSESFRTLVDTIEFECGWVDRAMSAE